MKRFLRLYRYAKTSGLARKLSPLRLAWRWWIQGQNFSYPEENTSHGGYDGDAGQRL